MIHKEMKNHKGAQPSPVAGMNMSLWLSQARLTESALETILTRTDLAPSQREKMTQLLLKVRSYLAEQLNRLNAPPAQGAPQTFNR